MCASCNAMVSKHSDPTDVVVVAPTFHTDTIPDYFQRMYMSPSFVELI